MAIVAAAVMIVVPAQAQDGQAAGRQVTLDGLLARFRAMPGLEAQFREEKHIALLAAPLVDEGVLRFAPPGRLLRRIERPSPSALRVDGDRLEVSEGSETRTIDLSDSPLVHAFVESFRALLAGDRAALERHFTLGFEPGTGGSWRLSMKPKDAGLAKAIRRIEVQGRGVVLQRLVVDEQSGDSSVTTFHDVDVHRRYGEADVRRLFRLR